MAWVYLLRGSAGRYYLGSTTDLHRRIEQHLRGHTHTTKRLGNFIELVASREFKTLEEARRIERMLKKWKKPERLLRYFQNHAS